MMTSDEASQSDDDQLTHTRLTAVEQYSDPDGRHDMPLSMQLQDGWR